MAHVIRICNSPPYRAAGVRLLAALIVWLALTLDAAAQFTTLPGSGSTAEPAGPAEAPPSDADLERLIEILEDPARRAELLATLRALAKAPAEGTPAESAPGAETTLPDDMVAGMLGAVSARTEIVRKVANAIVESLDRIPELLEWLNAQLVDPRQRALWLGVGLRVLAILGFGAMAFLLVVLVLRPVRHALAGEPDSGPVERALRLTIRLVLDLLPVFAFAVIAYATLVLLQPGETTRAVVLPLIYAGILARTGIAFARAAFAPKTPDLRLPPLSDGAAQYGFRWTRRILATAVYGYFALEAGHQLGLPWTIHGFLLHLLFFSIVVMLIVVIMQTRVAVATAIASLGDEGRSRLVRRLPWRGIAGTWHLLALFYILFVYAVWALKIPGGFRLLFGATAGSVAVVIACALALRIVNHLFGRDLHVADEAEALLPGTESRVNRYVPIVGGIVRVLILGAAAIGLLEVWGFGTLGWLLSDDGQAVTGHLITVAVIVVVTIAVWEAISLVIQRSITEKDEEGNPKLSNRARTLLNITRNFLLVFLSLIALFLILSELGLNIAPLLAGAGVIGLAIGFGSQKLVQDIITGMFVLLGDTIRVGDVVTVAGRTGVVDEMTMRTVVLRDYQGQVHTVPYSAIDTVTNMTKDFSYAVFEIGVAYRENVDEVMRVLREIGDEMNRDPHFRRLILEPLDVAGVDAFADSAVIIKARMKTRPLKQYEVGREFNRRVKNRFDELGIEIPYPHQTIYFGVDKQGRAPPARVALEAAGQPTAEPAEPAAEPAAVPETRPALAGSRGG